jgi:TolB-like protein/Flp pilus assembly protein TadD
MASLIPAFEYDIFISYRHNDNLDGWVSEFVRNLEKELKGTIKEPVSVYFDSNPQDGLLETHNVNKSLEGKLKCLIFIPIISQTYCDIKSFAWQHEFLAFRDQAKEDDFGIDVHLADRNVTSRILPVQIHELSQRDLRLFEKENGGPLRAMSFIFKSLGVNRPLTPSDSRNENTNKTLYRDQINKTANAIDQILETIQNKSEVLTDPDHPVKSAQTASDHDHSLWSELKRRNVFRAGFAYLFCALLLRQMAIIVSSRAGLSDKLAIFLDWFLLGGFPIALLLAWFFEASPKGFIRTTSAQSVKNPYRPGRKKPFTGNVTILMLCLLVISQFAYFYFTRNNSSGNWANFKESIAVLPFDNRSEEQDDEYFADGLTDEIIEHLSILGELHVINRQSIQEYRGDDLSYKKIASELNVANILTGSVRRSGGIVKISARLIECSTNKFLWGETFQRNSRDLMSIQSEIARSIASVLNIRINQLEKDKLDRMPTRNPTSYDYYLKGRTLYYQYQSKSNDQAIEHYKMAVALDPDYALAWAGLGDAYSQMHDRFGKDISWIDSSIAAGKKAIHLDSTISEGFKALANAYNYAGRYDTAFILLKKAVRLNSNNAQAIGNLGTSYFLRGDLPEALEWEKKAAGLNPKNAIPFQITGWIYQLLGDLPNAENWLKKSLELNATSYWDTYELLAYCYVSQGKKQDALKLVNTLMQKIHPDSRAYEVAGLMTHFAGDKTRAQFYFQQSIEQNQGYVNDANTVSPIGLGQILLEQGKDVEADVYLSHSLELNLKEIKNGSQDKDPPFRIASIYAIRGQREQAIEWLRKAINANWIDYNQLQYGPWFAKYRNDPEVKTQIKILAGKTEEMRKKAESL